MASIKYYVVALFFVASLLFPFQGQVVNAQVYYGSSNDPRIQVLLDLIRQAQALIDILNQRQGTNYSYNNYPYYGYQNYNYGNVLGTSTQRPEISNLSTYSGPIGTQVEIRGQRMASYGNSPTIWMEGSGGRWNLTPVYGITDSLITVNIRPSSCINQIYGYANCQNQNLVSGEYQIYIENNGQQSNRVSFTVTGNVLGYNNYNQYDPYNNNYSYNYYPYYNYNYPYQNAQVTSPLSGQIYTISQYIPINWEYFGGNTVEIKLRSENGGSCKITDVNSNQNFYSFRVLGSNCYSLVTSNLGDQFYVELKTYGYSNTNNYNQYIARQSDFFRIIDNN